MVLLAVALLYSRSHRLLRALIRVYGRRKIVKTKTWVLSLKARLSDLTEDLRFASTPTPPSPPLASPRPHTHAVQKLHGVARTSVVRKARKGPETGARWPPGDRSTAGGAFTTRVLQFPRSLSPPAPSPRPGLRAAREMSLLSALLVSRLFVNGLQCRGRGT